MIYWDNNATTPVLPEVVEAMAPYWSEQYFNPSAAYASARRVRDAVEEARASVALLAGVMPNEIIFTSGGTESTNAVLRSFASFTEKASLSLPTEHPASLACLEALGQPLLCPVDSTGQVQQPEWTHLLAQAGLVSFSLANHETGVIQPAEWMLNAAADAGLMCHVDAVQALGKIPLNLQDLPVHAASFSSHKLHGPKGIGALYLKSAYAWKPLLQGGSQEDGRRAGTLNVPGIIGFGMAARLAYRAQQEGAYLKLAMLRDAWEQFVLSLGGVIHGADAQRLPNTSNLRIEGCLAEHLTLLLEAGGLICSAGSACTSSNPKPSEILTAMGLSDAQVRGAMRFSLSRLTTQTDCLAAQAIFARAVDKLKSAQSSKTGPVVIYH